MRTKIRLLTLLVLMFAGTTLFAQDKAISGVVKDNTGAELSGATVSVKGTSNSVMTDAKGKFTIKANAKATLVVSFVGFESKEAVVGGQTTVNFSLAPGTSALNDVVVTSLGISKKQKALGYATSTISAEQITDAGTPNFATALYGKAPGVRIAATPGGATSAVNINIRGINSITGKNDPLIILDGIPIRNGEVRNDNYWSDQRLRGNGLLDLQTEDIENISILKGASAAALYGSEAVNGVVLVTTKQASKNRKGLGVDVSTNYSIDKIAYLPRYQNVRGYGISNVINNGGQDDAGFIYHDLNGDGIKETRSLLNFSINYGPKFDGQPILTWDNRIIPYSAQPDNYAGLFQTATNSSVNVAVSKATDNASIRFSLTRQANEGISMNSGSEKNTMNLNTSFRLSPKFSTDVMVNYINQTINNRPYSIDRMINNFTGMIGRFDNGEWYMNKAVTSKGYRYRTGTQQSATPAENIFTAGGGFKNDIADYAYRVKMHQLLEVSNRVIASMTNNYAILPDLKLRTRIATDFTSAKDETRQPNEVPLAFGNSGYFGLGQTQNTTIIW
jgi:iron complex outermembrane recepter protein